jgi:tRNA A37 methylthiotransferase MiaB
MNEHVRTDDRHLGQGCAQTADIENADMVILNTCSIREKPSRNSTANWDVEESGRGG